ncbi:hypothetical protein GCM10010269_15200 [Streptomyces humidus]|uniref:Uncharacterized protein n=1 Tax=Streptomyces humidus TaxID=52259 RepID=A0A918FT16_9ACTN|nr:hypothetical protein GCM10010269_15200 [Streptomyces humidus]
MGTLLDSLIDGTCEEPAEQMTTAVEALSATAPFSGVSALRGKRQSESRRLHAPDRAWA